MFMATIVVCLTTLETLPFLVIFPLKTRLEDKTSQPSG
jgi:hypothetical protein